MIRATITLFSTRCPHLQIHRLQEHERPKCRGDGFPMAASTLLVLSLRPPLFPIPMASSRWRASLSPDPVAAPVPSVSPGPAE